MNVHARSVAVIVAVISLAVAGMDAQAKGGSAGKVSGWSVSGASASTTSGTQGGSSTSSTSGSGQSGGKGNKGSSVQGFSVMNATSAPSMGGMLMTPNGMIVHNTPSETVVSSNSLMGSSSVGMASKGIGNSQVNATALGMGNSQGSGGTVEIARMTHFGVSGFSYVSSIIGAAGVSVSSIINNVIGSSGASSATPSSGTSGSAGGSGASSQSALIKAHLMGAPTNSACVSTSGAKSGCS